MARSIEPYRDQDLPDQFTRWLEFLRGRIKTIPCFTYSAGSPEAVINGQKGDLYYDTTALVYYEKTTDTGNTGWRLLSRPVTATTAELEAIGNAINTDAAKILGYMVENATTGATVFAAGAADGSVWHFYDSSLAHTPI